MFRRHTLISHSFENDGFAYKVRGRMADTQGSERHLAPEYINHFIRNSVDARAFTDHISEQYVAQPYTKQYVLYITCIRYDCFKRISRRFAVFAVATHSHTHKHSTNQLIAIINNCWIRLVLFCCWFAKNFPAFLYSFILLRGAKACVCRRGMLFHLFCLCARDYIFFLFSAEPGRE